MDYNNFETDDFVTDISFIKWVKFPDSESDQFWKDFVEKNPHKIKIINEAKDLIGAINFNSFEPDVHRIDRIYKNIQGGINKKKNRLRYIPLSTLSLAAGISFMFFCTGWWIWSVFMAPKTNIETNFGQIKKIELSDGTLITLNGNTKLKIADLKNLKKREVWLDGEALFEVSKSKSIPFIVHTPQRLDVNVMGTIFNLGTRRQNASITLKEGKVQLVNLIKAKKTIMKPGERAVYSQQTGSLKISVVDPYVSSSWAEGIMVLDNMSVQMIINYLKDTYNIDLKVGDKALLNKQLLGKISIKNVDEFIDNIGTSLDMKVKKSGEVYQLIYSE